MPSKPAPASPYQIAGRVLVVLVLLACAVSLAYAFLLQPEPSPDSMNAYKQNEILSAELPALVVKGDGCLFVINRNTSTHEVQTVDITGETRAWLPVAALAERTLVVTGHKTPDFDRIWRVCTDALLIRAQHNTPTP